jgi:hypothetical protein
MSSWPAFFAAALAIWLVLKGPASAKPSWVQRLCRVAIAFCLYSGFLYLLKWNPFWTWMPLADPQSRNKTEGVLILIATLVWFMATLRILFKGSRLPAVRAGSSDLVNPAARDEKTRRRISLTDIALFYFFTRK